MEEPGAAAPAAGQKRPVSKEEVQEVLDKITDKEWELVKNVSAGRRGSTSSAWETFRFVVHKQTKIHQGFVKCVNCDVVYRWDRSQKRSPPTTSLIAHANKCQKANAAAPPPQEKGKPTSADRLVFRDACVNVMAGDLRPSTTFSSPEFVNLIQATCDIQAKHGSRALDAALLISDRTTLVRHLEEKADQGRSDVREALQNSVQENVGRGATTDMWTDQFKQRQYMSLTMHLIDHSHRLLKLILSVSQFKGDSESSDLLANHLSEELRRFNVDPSTVVFVTDGAQNIVKALKILNIKRLYCMDHCLNIVLRSSFNMKMVDLNLFGAAGDTLFEWVSLAVTYTRASRRRGKPEALRTLKKPPPPKSDSSRRYSSRIPCLKSLRENFDEVSNFLRENGQEEVLGHLELEKINTTVDFLQPIDERAKAHGNDLAEVDIGWLDSHIADKPGDSPYLLELKNNARVQLAGRHAIKIMQKCKDIVTLFKRWGINHLLDETLKQEIPTRWNSLLIMLMSFPNNFEQVNTILRERGQEDLILSDEEQTDIKALIEFLRPWKEQSDKVEGDTYPTLQYVLTAACHLADVCTANPMDSDKIRHLRARAGSLLKEKFIPDNLHKVATFLWPDFRSLRMLQTSAQRKEVYDLAANMISKFDTGGPSRKRLKRGDGYDKWRSGLVDADLDLEDDEIEEYLSGKFDLCPGEKLHVWWQQQAHRFPKLAKLAREVLSIPASSASSERAFSVAGLLLSSRRTCMSAEHLDDMVFMRGYLFYKRQLLVPLPELQDLGGADAEQPEDGRVVDSDSTSS